ncbi:response regulator [Flavobacterium sp. MAHUQ-51]|uniref:response regulator n=1 Tax=Flavobacterium sp. GCM10022190 TaxID=3252639 RepID=UPI00361874B3
MKKKLNCILLIDDDAATNFINRRVIEKADITENIFTALNGKEAINFLTNKGNHQKEEDAVYPQPNLILLDINMPIMDGWEFLEAYEKLDENQKSKIIIVMLTTSFNPDDKTRAEKIETISGFKNKPLSAEILNDLIKTHFPEYI